MSQQTITAARGRKRPEQSLQITVADFLRVALRPPTIWTAFPAGGGGKVRGAFLKAMGLQAGWPDILVAHPLTRSNHGVILVGIELKSHKGKVSPAQEVMADDFIRAGAHYPLCRSLEEVEKFLRKFGIPLHATAGHAAESIDAVRDRRGRERSDRVATPSSKASP